LALFHFCHLLVTFVYNTEGSGNKSYHLAISFPSQEKATVKRIILAIATFTCMSAAIALLSGFTLPEKPSVASRCPRETLVASNTTSHQVHPEKVIVKPWKGRHHVYGIFVLPNEYKASDFFMVSVEGASSYCGGQPVAVAGKKFQGVRVKPGERILVGYFRTRTASWLIAQGKIEQLKQPRNWVLRVQKHD